jgi:8-oxo-dGTP pyrophosphatase MutT (NUDIX family)
MDSEVCPILIPAAVLIPLIERSGVYTILLTQRTAHLENHAGQISFPGGRVEDQDASPIDTALRETEEEIGLARNYITDILGYLDLYQTVTGFLVTPVVGLITTPFELVIDTCEVQETFEVPLDFILDVRNHKRRSVMQDGRTRHFFVINYEQRHIWGATAAMLINLAQRLREIPL